MPEKSNQARMLLPSAVVAALLGVAAAVLWRQDPPAPELQSGILLQQPRPVASFELLDQDGQPFTQDKLQGAWSIVFAGFTYCPDVCPTTLALLRQVEKDLGPDAARVRTVFLSVDPGRDTPERMQQYISHFSKDFTGVTGDQEQVTQLCKDLGIAWIKVPGESENDYTIDHSTSLVLLNPEGRVAAYLQAPHKAPVIADDLRRLLEYYT